VVLQECKEENYEFIKKVFDRSGISPTASYLPAWINPAHTKEPKYDMDSAKKEAEMTMCGAVADLLEKTGEGMTITHARPSFDLLCPQQLQSLKLLIFC
jgi:hypothetical protein